jgi:hypothetical protein
VYHSGKKEALAKIYKCNIDNCFCGYQNQKDKIITSLIIVLEQECKGLTFRNEDTAFRKWIFLFLDLFLLLMLCSICKCLKAMCCQKYLDVRMMK